jgi:hypothetical protein
MSRRVRCEVAGMGGIHNSIRRRDFLKSGMALAVAAELGTGIAQGLVPQGHRRGESGPFHLRVALGVYQHQ